MMFVVTPLLGGDVRTLSLLGGGWATGKGWDTQECREDPCQGRKLRTAPSAR